MIRAPRGLIFLLLTRLDAASECIEALDNAFKADDPGRALMVHASLQRAWGDALAAILVLEQMSGRPEEYARNALDHLYRRARIPLALASNIISRLPNEHYIVEPGPWRVLPPRAAIDGSGACGRDEAAAIGGRRTGNGGQPWSP